MNLSILISQVNTAGIRTGLLIPGCIWAAAARRRPATVPFILAVANLIFVDLLIFLVLNDVEKLASKFGKASVPI